MHTSKSSNRFSLSFWPYFILLTTGGLTLGTLLLSFMILQTGQQLFQGVIASVTVSDSQAEIRDPNLIVKQLQGVSELTTAIFTMEAVVPTSQDRKIGELIIGTTQLLYIAHGQVKAGIDLGELSTNHILIDNNQVKITLPAPQILDSKIDVNRSHVYDYNRGFFNLGPDTAPQLQTLAQQKTLSKILKSACDQGILEEANSRAEIAITQLLKTAGYQEVEINTTLPKPNQCLEVKKISFTNGTLTKK